MKRISCQYLLWSLASLLAIAEESRPGKKYEENLDFTLSNENVHRSEKFYNFENSKSEINFSNSMENSEESVEIELEDNLEIKTRKMDSSLWTNFEAKHSPWDSLIFGTKFSYTYYTRVDVQNNNGTKDNVVGWRDPLVSVGYFPISLGKFKFKPEFTYRLDVYDNSVTKNRHLITFEFSGLRELSFGNFNTGFLVSRYHKQKASRTFYEGNLFAGIEYNISDSLLVGSELAGGYREKRTVESAGPGPNQITTYHISENFFGSAKVSSFYYFAKHFALFVHYKLTQNSESDQNKMVYTNGGLVSRSNSIESYDSEYIFDLGLRARF